MWAATQINLGSVLHALGERETETKNLEKSVIAYRKALQELSYEHVPLLWALAQSNLGTALTLLGEQEIKLSIKFGNIFGGRVAGKNKLKKSIVAFKEALNGWQRERVPLDWAKAKNNLGITLDILGKYENGTQKLEEAIIVYREALEEWTREKVPLDWAAIQNNLGLVLTTLGERENGTYRLEEAIVEVVSFGWTEK
jgi:tetratricopeptide (TPR) repeat protein